MAAFGFFFVGETDFVQKDDDDGPTEPQGPERPSDPRRIFVGFKPDEKPTKIQFLKFGFDARDSTAVGETDLGQKADGPTSRRTDRAS